MAQGFNYVHNDYGKDPTRITRYLMTNSEAGLAGEAIKIVSGRVTKAGATDPIAGFLNASVTAGTDQPTEIILAREGDVFEVPYTGTPAGGFVEGLSVATIATDGLSLASATVTGGSIAVLEINTNKKTAKVKVKVRQFS